MQDFSSISVSSYEAGSLADRLTEQSHDGWHVVAIVPTGSTVTAYLCREAEGAAVAEPEIAEPEIAEPESTPEPTPEPTIEPEPTFAAVVPEPAAEPAPEAASSEPVSADVATAAETNTSDATATTAGAAPAGWYADPAGRFELRYWDGGQWTEHVSRAGQQYTDPPVA